MKKLLFWALFALPFFAFSQSFYNLRLPRNVNISGGVINSQYIGDLYPGSGKGQRNGINLGVEYFIGGRVSVRSEFNAFRLYGSDALAKPENSDEQGARNLSFFSNNKELNVTGTLNLLPLPNRFDQRPYINLYGFAGFGLLWMNPKTKYEGDKVALQPLQTEGVSYSRIQPVFPVGFGLKIKVRMVYSIVFEGGYRFTNTDYIDDVSGRPDPGGLSYKGRYADPATLKNPLAVALSDRRQEKDPSSNFPYTFGVRGNPQTKDAYFLFNVKVEYYLKEIFDPYNRGRNKLLYIRKNRQGRR